MPPTQELRICDVECLALKEAVTADPLSGASPNSAPANLFITIELRGGGDRFIGRSQVSARADHGGRLAPSSRRYLDAAARRLIGVSIEAPTAGGTLTLMSDLLSDLDELAQDQLEESRREEPFQAIRMGFIEALVGALEAEPSEAPTRACDAFHDLVLRCVGDFVRYPEPEAPRFGGRPSNTYPELEYLLPLGVNGTKGHLLERQALARGLATVRFSKGTFIAHDGSDERMPLNFKWSRSPLSSSVSIALCSHKDATRALLSEHGLPVPRGRMFPKRDYASAVAFAERIGYPVVCKPATGVRGIGVVANIQDEGELRRAFKQYEESRLGDDDFIVEQHITGSDYRIVVLGDQVIAAILREPASVIGDGKRTVAELILHKNAVRHQNPHLWGRPINFNDDARHWLERQEVGLSSVPIKGHQVILSSTCSLSQGGDSVDVLDELDPSISEAAVGAVRAIPGMGFCGVDFLLDDHRKPLGEQRSAGICELNAHAAIGNGEYPMFGQPREVAGPFLELAARTYGYEVAEPPMEELSLSIHVRGRVTGVGYRAWFAEHARRFGLAGWIRNATQRRVEIRLEGPTLPATALASAAALGPRSALPTSVRTRHVATERLEGFEIRA